MITLRTTGVAGEVRSVWTSLWVNHVTVHDPILRLIILRSLNSGLNYSNMRMKCESSFTWFHLLLYYFFVFVLFLLYILMRFHDDVISAPSSKMKQFPCGNIEYTWQNCVLSIWPRSPIIRTCLSRALGS